MCLIERVVTRVAKSDVSGEVVILGIDCTRVASVTRCADTLT